MPGIDPHRDDRDFWTHCNRRSLRFQGCADCGRLRHPPTPMCPNCQSTLVKWIPAPDIGTVFSYTVIHHAAHPAVKDQLPYVVAVIEFASLPGVRLVSNLTDVDPATVRIGQPVRLWWDDMGPQAKIPRFRPVS